MARHRHSLKALRNIVLAHNHGGQPDLPALARELGSVIHRDSQLLDQDLVRLSQRQNGFERWLLVRRSRPAMSMLVMAWPANHAMPAHDHAGLWGLEVILRGALEVQSWSRQDPADAWQPPTRDWLGPGDATWFDADTRQMHRCRNLSRHDTAFSLHVYGGDLTAYPAYSKNESDPHWQTPPHPAVITRHLAR